MTALIPGRRTAVCLLPATLLLLAVLLLLGPGNSGALSQSARPGVSARRFSPAQSSHPIRFHQVRPRYRYLRNASGSLRGGRQLAVPRGYGRTRGRRDFSDVRRRPFESPIARETFVVGQPASGWRMFGANPEHTRFVETQFRPGLRRWMRLSPVQLGARPGEAARIHPRTLSSGVLLAEVDTPHAISLVALSVRTGRLLWRRRFPAARLFEDAGLYPAVSGAAGSLYLALASGAPGASPNWNLHRFRLFDGHLEWETGTARLGAVISTPGSTLFRPVIASGPLYLVVPDFFGRPPLVAFQAATGVVAWYSNAYGADVPLVDERAGPAALSADWVEGRPVLALTRLNDGTLVARRAGAAAEKAPPEAAGVWDVQPVWADPLLKVCGLVATQLQKGGGAVSSVLSLPGLPPRVDWNMPSKLRGPVTGEAIFTAALPEEKPGIYRRSETGGAVLWSADGPPGTMPLAAAPGVVIGRWGRATLASWSSTTGKLLWRAPAPGLRELIIGEGAIAAAGHDGQSYLLLYR